MTAIACTFLICATVLTGFLFWLRDQPKISRAEFEELKNTVSRLQQHAANAIARKLGGG